MAVQSAHSGMARPAVWRRDDVDRKRRRRWHFFQVAFAATCLGILLDIVTSMIGFQQMGSSYEQNPLAKTLILNIGWAGLVLVFVAVCGVCYLSFRAVYARMSPHWALVGNTLIVIVALMRWFVVSVDLYYLVFPGH